MKKKVLIVSDCPSHKTNAGNRNCILQNSMLLKQNGFSVDFLFLQKGKVNEEDMSEMKEFWGTHLYLFKQNSLQTFIQNVILKLSHLLNCNYPFMDILCPWGIKRTVNRLIKDNQINSIIVNYVWLSKVIDKIDCYSTAIYTHDVFTNRNMNGLSSWYSFSPSDESRALLRAKHILAIQENESIFYSYLCPVIDVRTVYMPFNYTSLPYSDNNLLFFSGGNEHNLNAIKDFINNIFPSLLKVYPTLKLLIGGSICELLRNEILDSHIKLKGGYDDPANFYSLGNIVINPVFSGTGLKVKTFEAVSYGRLVLAHPHSLEGIYKKDRVPIVSCRKVDDYLAILEKVISGKLNFSEIDHKCQNYIEDLNTYILNNYKEVL